MKLLSAQQTLPDSPYCSVEPSRAKLNGCDGIISLKYFLSIYEADGYDKKHDKEEKAHVFFYLFTNRKYGSQNTKNAITVKRNF